VAAPLCFNRQIGGGGASGRAFRALPADTSEIGGIPLA
jgi:hypothetical protein